MDRLDQVFNLLKLDAMLLTNTSEDLVAAIQVVAGVLNDQKLADECVAKLGQIGASVHHPNYEPPQKPVTPISVDMVNGRIEGYVSVRGSTESLFNYLQEQVGSIDMTAMEILMALDSAGEAVTVVKSLHVEEAARGQGLGGLLLQKFFEDADTPAFVLLCDSHQEQADGFSLERFYEGFDFERVIETSSGPLMIYPPEIAALAREKLGPAKASEPIPQVRAPRP